MGEWFPLTIRVSVVTVTAFCAGIAVMWLIAKLQKTFESFKRKKRFKRGTEGEAEACLYLQKHGFSICRAQDETAASMLINGISHDYTVRADYVAVKKGKRCIVEVKTGKKAVDPLFSDTRRQLLEYAVVYKVDNIFLFNADDGILMKIDFPGVTKKKKMLPRWIFFLIGLVSGGIVLVLLWHPW